MDPFAQRRLRPAPEHVPALALYRRRGFRDGEAFSDYVRSEFNQFLHLDL
jgi:putative acetyltransferase